MEDVQEQTREDVAVENNDRKIKKLAREREGGGVEEGYKPHKGFRQKEEIRREGEFKVSVSRSLAQK